MGGKLAGFILMALAALFAWRWLRAPTATSTANSPGRRNRPDANRAASTSAQEEGIITLEQDPETGVFRPPTAGDNERKG